MSIADKHSSTPFFPAFSARHSGMLVLHPPHRDDGAAIHALIRACPPLDCNSCYAYLVLAEHFADTCVVARGTSEQVVGFVSAYVPPGRPDTLFVWQVAVHPDGRGQGLAQRMLTELLQRPACTQVDHLETTVSPGNLASRALFERFARSQGASLTERSLFRRWHFGADAHEDEPLLCIGPLVGMARSAVRPSLGHSGTGPPVPCSD